jgi:hypothetical protein
VGSLYVGLVLLMRIALGPARRARLHEAIAVLVASLPALLFVPCIMGKSSMGYFMWGWATGYSKEELASFANLSRSFEMWWGDGWYIFIVIGCGLLLARACVSAAALFTLFLGANFFLLAEWEWDQIKIFIALYLIALARWSVEERNVVRVAQILSIALIIPAIGEIYIIAKKRPMHTVFSRQLVVQAEVIRNATQPNDIIAAAPNHNSVAILTGRKMFIGYAGWLHSHGIKYRDRENQQRDFLRLASCQEKSCPRYLVWGDAEKKWWGRERPPAELFHEVVPGLYSKEPLK